LYYVLHYILLVSLWCTHWFCQWLGLFISLQNGAFCNTISQTIPPPHKNHPLRKMLKYICKQIIWLNVSVIWFKSKQSSFDLYIHISFIFNCTWSLHVCCIIIFFSSGTPRFRQIRSRIRVGVTNKERFLNISYIKYGSYLIILIKIYLIIFNKTWYE